MTLTAVTGPAGVGKTHTLMIDVADAMSARPLRDGERVLALTFMHGSRRRLDGRLSKLPGLKNRYRCTTVDRFAWELCTRWRGLRESTGRPGLQEHKYDATCDEAGALLESPAVLNWVAQSYPIVVIDEAQDLKPERLRMVRALESRISVFVAADEFQCLDPTLRPSPALEWIQNCTKPRALTLPQRTKVATLLAAASALRGGRDISSAKPDFVVVAAPGKHPFPLAATYLANAIAWNGGHKIAVITPSKSGGYAASVVKKVTSGPVGKKQTGPFPIDWELSDSDSASATARGLSLPRDGDCDKLLEAIDQTPYQPALRLCREWIVRQRRLGARTHFPPEVIKDRLEFSLAQHRRHGRPHRARIRAMTVHQAKNREFDGAVVIWPYSVVGNPEQQRRLLYNAVTRAKRWCTVIAQGSGLLTKPPFVSISHCQNQTRKEDGP